MLVQQRNIKNDSRFSSSAWQTGLLLPFSNEVQAKRNDQFWSPQSTPGPRSELACYACTSAKNCTRLQKRIQACRSRGGRDALQGPRPHHTRLRHGSECSAHDRTDSSDLKSSGPGKGGSIRVYRVSGLGFRLSRSGRALV